MSYRDRLSNYEIVRIDSFLSTGLIHPNFHQFIEDGTGKSTLIPFTIEDFYEGHLIGEPRNRVVLSRLPSGGYIGTIYIKGGSIHLEPIVIHEDNADERDILVYRSLNVNFSRFTSSFNFDRVLYAPYSFEVSIYLEYVIRLTVINLGQGSSPNTYSKSFDLLFRRKKRQLVSVENEKRNRCPLKIVADYKFYSIVGKNSTALTTRYIVNMVARVNEIFNRVNWDEQKEDMISERGRFFNMGFAIKELKILDKPNANVGHYNAIDFINSGLWKSDRLLEAFTRFESSRDFCLVHLLTAQSFADKAAIGLAYVADLRSGTGGICSDSGILADRHVTFNTVFTSAVGNSGTQDYPLVTREAEIVVAHEYGHSWGAPHDGMERQPEDRENSCTPEYKDGGNYIMNMYAQNGYDPNNNRRWLRCFEEEKSSFCGNGVVEDGEQCDEGAKLPDNNGVTACCTGECKLAPKAVCSPKNHPCCTWDCSYHNASHICLPANEWQCKGAAYCSGLSGECPLAPPIRDGSPCVEDGECKAGRCLPYCERSDIGKKTCICEEVDLSCRRCCRSENVTSKCEPQEGAADLKDGTWCVRGYCKNSKCLNEVADFITNSLGVLSDGSRIWPFVQSNIVGIIVVLSLCVWCPVGCWIAKVNITSNSCCDKLGELSFVSITAYILQHASQRYDHGGLLHCIPSIPYRTSTPPSATPFITANTLHPVVVRNCFKRNPWKHFQSYGKNYNVMNGAVVYKDEEVAKLEGIETIEYLESLYVEPKLDLGIHHIPPNEQFQYIYGSIYKIRGNDDAWLIKSDDRELRILTTFTIQSTICAALNSRKCLHWVFGVDSMGKVRFSIFCQNPFVYSAVKVIGCPLSREQRDLFRQIFDFALDSEFVPSLDPSLVRLNFVGVEGRGDSQTSYLVEIVMNHKVTVLYQLSSGRIFYVENGRTKKMKSMDEARRMLLNRRQEDCTYIIKEMHKTGQLMYIPSITIYRSHLSSFFCGVYYGGTASSQWYILVCQCYGYYGEGYFCIYYVDIMCRDAIILYVRECQRKDGGFAAAENHDSHLLHTLSAVQILIILNAIDEFDVDAISRYVKSLQNDDGSFGGDYSSSLLPNVRKELKNSSNIYLGNVNIRFFFVLIFNLYYLYYIKNAMKTFIYACQDDEAGGFADRPGDYPDPFHTLFGLAGLSLFGETALSIVDAVFCMTKRSLKGKSLC
uniref:Peptidase M12B domain-containing protein n=1 Tax=Heterorhabditis bacteriophora TaxID=37862 RepID=A0A1I7XW17_HETBA